MSKKRKKYTKSERRKMKKMKQKRKNQKMIIGCSAVIVLIIGVILVVTTGNNTDEITKDNQIIDSTEIDDTQINIPISSLDTEAKFYSYNNEGVDIQYFAVKGSDGQVHVALDACDVCYHAKKGYKQINDVMHCINCGNEYPINGLGTENTAGGCWPSYIPITIQDDSILIEKLDLDDKRYMFI